MIEGHGDDLYRYNDIKMNFSSNIYNGTDLSALNAYLCSRLDVVRSYPEPSAATLERLIADECGISPDEVLVTNTSSGLMPHSRAIICSSEAADGSG